MEEVELVNWSRTRVALRKLMSLFTCTACGNALREPCSFQMCDHYFCKACAMDLINKGTNCPSCNAVLWREHLQTNLKVPEVMKICGQIKSLICKDEPCNGEGVIVNIDNTIQNVDNNNTNECRPDNTEGQDICAPIIENNCSDQYYLGNTRDTCINDICNDICRQGNGKGGDIFGDNIDNGNMDEGGQRNEEDICIHSIDIENKQIEEEDRSSHSDECNTYMFECPKSSGTKRNIVEKIVDTQCHNVDIVEINDDSELFKNKESSYLDGATQDHIHCSIAYPKPLEVVTHLKNEITFNDDSEAEIFAFPLTNESNEESMVVGLHNIKEEIDCNNKNIFHEENMRNESATSRTDDHHIDSSIDFINYGKYKVAGNSDFQCKEKDRDIVLTKVKCKEKRKIMTCNLTTEPEDGPLSQSPEKSQFSNAVSDLDCVKGVQRNPNSFAKKPKFTYGKKSKGTIKTTAKHTNVPLMVTSRASTFKEEQSVFDFSSGTITKSIKFTKKGEESSEDDSLGEPVNVTLYTKRKRSEQDSKAATKKVDYGKGKCHSEIDNKKENKENYKEKEKKTDQGKVKKSKIRNLEKKNKKGETPLHTACIKGNHDRVKELLELGAQANTKDFNGWTPLHEASNHGFATVVELLLDYNAIIDCVAGEDNDTPLHDAVCNNCVEVSRLLLQRGAPTNIKNRVGLYPEDYACTNEMKNVFKEMNMFETNETSFDNQLNVSSASTGAPFVFITTNLNSIENTEVMKCCNRLGGELLSEFDLSVTHVICGVDSTGENNISKSRTMKYLLGLLTGKWMVSLTWISNSLKANKWAPEASYEIKGSYGAMDEVPQKSRINSFKCLPKLFEGCSFYLSGVFNKPLSKEVLMNLIKLGGGKILYREPKTNNLEPSITPLSPQNRTLNLVSKVNTPVTIYHAKENSAQVCCNEYIIYAPRENPGHKKICSPILCTAPVPWLLDCISNFQILDVEDAYDQKEVYTSSQN